MKKKKSLLVYGLLTLAVLVYIFIASPNLNPLYQDGAFFWVVLITLYVGAYLLQKFGDITLKPNEHGGPKQIDFGLKGKLPKKLIFLVAIPWAIFVVVILFSSVIFHAKDFREQLSTPVVKEFSDTVSVIDINNIPVVDKSLAAKLAEKKLGEKPSLGSQVVPGEPTIQQVNGKLVWVVPLEHSGFFKWLSNMDGTPGYIIVSATNQQDVTYVENYKIKYQANAYLLDNLTRHVRLGNALVKGITDYSFELDDTGRPYWVVSTYKNTCGFSLPEADGIILVDAETGKMQRYALDEVPQWVDRVQPESFIRNQINNKGEYVHGIFNFSNRDKFRSSEGHIIVYNNDNCYFFTGITSVGKDESAIGFYMVDMVTKEVFEYQVSGATESAAQQSAEGKVQHLGYKASFPVILNTAGQPTYFMTLKDKEELIKQYAFVSVKDYSTVGVGDTITEAMRNYEQSLKNSGNSLTEDVTGEKIDATGTVARINSEVRDGVVHYRILLNEVPDVLFDATFDLSDELALTQVGDKVKIEYYDAGNATEAAITFDNLEITTRTK